MRIRKLTVSLAIVMFSLVAMVGSESFAQSGSRSVAPTAPRISTPSFSGSSSRIPVQSAPTQQSYAAPVQSYVPSQSYASPARTYSAPARVYASPTQSYTAAQSYAPVQNYAPVQSYAAPVQSYPSSRVVFPARVISSQPHRCGGSYSPVRVYSHSCGQ